MTLPIHSILITGASRGIGLGFVKKFLENPNVEIVIASCRNPSEAKELNAITDKRLHIIQLDVTCDQSIEDAVSKVDQLVGLSGLTLLINNAGYLPGYEFTSKPDRKTINATLNVNATSVLLMMQTFYPLLKRAAEKVTGDEFSVSRAAIVNISSDSGSITIQNPSNYMGVIKQLDYCMSKSAMNQASRIVAHDIKADCILVAAIHPGWVKTEMGTEHAEISVEESVADMVGSIYILNKCHTGGFFDRHLEVMPF